MALAQRLQTAISVVYPTQCLTCGTPVEGMNGLCGACWRDTGFIGGTLCDACGVPLPGESVHDDAPLCNGCMEDPRPWVQGRSAITYSDAGRRLVLALKHGDRQEIAPPAGRWMAAAVRDLVQSATLVVPVPLHWTRMLKRRYNQSALLARSISAELSLVWSPDALQRVQRTPSLDGKSRVERHQIVQDAVRVNPKRRVQMAGRQVLLVDDVMTTGATLAACARACHAAGASQVRVVTLARVIKEA